MYFSVFSTALLSREDFFFLLVSQQSPSLFNKTILLYIGSRKQGKREH
jgi:hypothetical protein